MVQRYRRGYSVAERTELWDRWQRGESLKAIGRAFGKPSSSVTVGAPLDILASFSDDDGEQLTEPEGDGGAS